jgi:hypothetical protein
VRLQQVSLRVSLQVSVLAVEAWAASRRGVRLQQVSLGVLLRVSVLAVAQRCAASRALAAAQRLAASSAEAPLDLASRCRPQEREHPQARLQ